VSDIDTTRLLISPRDRVYRILSRELEYESRRWSSSSATTRAPWRGRRRRWSAPACPDLQAGSSTSSPARWRPGSSSTTTMPGRCPTSTPTTTFGCRRHAGGGRLQDGEATWWSRRAWPRTTISTFSMAPDGDDWTPTARDDPRGCGACSRYANRGRRHHRRAHCYGSNRRHEVERYLKRSGLLEEKPELLRLDVMGERRERDADHRGDQESYFLTSMELIDQHTNGS